MVVLMRSKSIDDNPHESHWSSKATLPIVREEDSKSSIVDSEIHQMNTLKPKPETHLHSIKSTSQR